LDARGQINKALKSILEKAKDRHQRDLERICKKTSIDHYIQHKPNIIRQTLMDAAPKEKAQLRWALCRTPLIDFLSRSTSCENIEEIPNSNSDSKLLQVKQVRSSYPYRTRMNYQILAPKEPTDSNPIEISTQITIKTSGNLPQEELESRVLQMQTQIDAFYSCSTGRIPAIQGVTGLTDRAQCPPHPDMKSPPVRFKISLVKSPPAPESPPIVKLHQCYNSELPEEDRGDCEKARLHRVQRCEQQIRLAQRLGTTRVNSRYAPPMAAFLENIAITPDLKTTPSSSKETRDGIDILSLPEAEILPHCERQNPPSQDGRYDRENSSNYTLNTPASTIMHEITHALGSGDEYQDPTYPFLPQGEHDSLMNNPRHPAASLKPRHIKNALSPLRCIKLGKVSPGTPR